MRKCSRQIFCLHERVEHCGKRQVARPKAANDQVPLSIGLPGSIYAAGLLCTWVLLKSDYTCNTGIHRMFSLN